MAYRPAADAPQIGIGQPQIGLEIGIEAAQRCVGGLKRQPLGQHPEQGNPFDGLSMSNGAKRPLTGTIMRPDRTGALRAVLQCPFHFRNAWGTVHRAPMGIK
jgi:hypothetical protein